MIEEWRKYNRRFHIYFVLIDGQNTGQKYIITYFKSPAGIFVGYQDIKGSLVLKVRCAHPCPWGKFGVNFQIHIAAVARPQMQSTYGYVFLEEKSVCQQYPKELGELLRICTIDSIFTAGGEVTGCLEVVSLVYILVYE